MSDSTKYPNVEHVKWCTVAIVSLTQNPFYFEEKPTIMEYIDRKKGKNYWNYPMNFVTRMVFTQKRIILSQQNTSSHLKIQESARIFFFAMVFVAQSFFSRKTVILLFSEILSYLSTISHLNAFKLTWSLNTKPHWQYWREVPTVCFH